MKKKKEEEERLVFGWWKKFFKLELPGSSSKALRLFPGALQALDHRRFT